MMIKSFRIKYKEYINKKKYKTIINSKLFDESFYLESYPDVKKYNGKALLHYILHGEKEGRKPNPYFDPIWYVSTNKKSMGRGNSPLLHYITLGESKGLKPSMIFDPVWYKNKYSDIKKSSLKPLEHYLAYGLSENRSPNKYFNSSLSRNGLLPAEFYSENSQNIYNDDFDDKNRCNMRIAVVVHVYYLDMIPSILEYILNIPYDYNLYLTVSKESSEDLVQLLEMHNVSKYELIEYPNQGYDIAPFLHLLSVLKKQNYELICKVHTKKGPTHLEIYNHWFDSLVKPILGSARTVGNIVAAFTENKALGVVGSADFYKSVQQLMYGNDKPVEEILLTIDKSFDPSQEWGFFAGTIFWARLKTFDKLLENEALDQLIEKNIKIEMESGAPVSIFHSLERVLGALPKITKMKTGLSHRMSASQGSYAIQVLPEDYNSPSSVGIHATLVEVVGDSLNE